MTVTEITAPTETTEKLIPVGLIDPPAWNSRTVKAGPAAKEDEKELDELAASLHSQGQLQAIEVEEGNGRYELVFGSRRLAAAKRLQWKEIRANVRPSSSANRRIVRNIVENERRANLTTFEQARAFTQLREMGLKNDEIATTLHKSKSHVSNQIGTYTGLPDPIKTEWSLNHPAASFDFLREVSQLKDDETKMRAWDARVNELATAQAAGQKPGKRGKGKNGKGGAVGISLVQANIKQAIDLFSKRSMADVKIGGTYAFMMAYTNWLIGQRKTAPEDILAALKAAEDKEFKPTK